MTAVLGGRDAVITGLSVGEGGRGRREGKEEGWKGEKGKGMERVRREGRGERRVIKEIQVYALIENAHAKHTKNSKPGGSKY